MSDYDAIVVGAGHNGLTAGLILARQGHKVLCLEKTNWPGGQAATKELFKGFKHSVGAWALLIFREEMIRILELDQHGFELIRPKSSYTVFGKPEDKPFIGYTDVEDLANHIMTDHGVDAMEAFAHLGEYFAVFKEMFEQQLHQVPDKIEKIIAEAPDEKTREILGKMCYGSAVEVMREFFTDPEKHKLIIGSLSASAIDGTHYGPYSPGSALSLAYHFCAGDNYDFKIPKGGIGSLSTALVSVFEKYGGELRYKSIVEGFTMDGNKVTGVKLKGGETISAKAVLSTLDARSTFLRLADPKTLPQEFVNSVEEIQHTNGYIQLHMTLKELPTFSGHMSWVNDKDERWLVAYIPSAQHLHECWEQYKRNEVPEDPVAYCYFPSMMDPTLAPEGQHTCTIFSHYFPADFPDGNHSEMKELMVERVLQQIENVAPGFKDLIMDKVVFTHQYFEKTFGLTDGDFASGLLHPGQMFGNRPVPGWAGHKTPLESLYMVGAACHPGPGVTCIPGYNGAYAVLDDWGEDVSSFETVVAKSI